MSHDVTGVSYRNSPGLPRPETRCIRTPPPRRRHDVAKLLECGRPPRPAIAQRRRLPLCTRTGVLSELSPHRSQSARGLSTLPTSSLACRTIPKGLRPSAQGCAAPALPWVCRRCVFQPQRGCASGVAGRTQPRWG
jgi:hypothetical protein